MKEVVFDRTFSTVRGTKFFITGFVDYETLLISIGGLSTWVNINDVMENDRVLLKEYIKSKGMRKGKL